MPVWPGRSSSQAAEGDASELMEGSASWQRANGSGPPAPAELAAAASTGGVAHVDLAGLAHAAGSLPRAATSHDSAGNLAAAAAVINAGAVAVGVAAADAPFYRELGETLLTWPLCEKRPPPDHNQEP